MDSRLRGNDDCGDWWVSKSRLKARKIIFVPMTSWDAGTTSARVVAFGYARCPVTSFLYQILLYESHLLHSALSLQSTEYCSVRKLDPGWAVGIELGNSEERHVG